MKIHHSNEERSPERGYRRKAVNLKGSFAMDKRFAQINNELSEMQDGKLSKYGMTDEREQESPSFLMTGYSHAALRHENSNDKTNRFYR